MSRRWRKRNWCQNEVHEETKGADSSDKVKHNERSDQLFLEDDVGEKLYFTMKIWQHDK